MKPLSKEAMKYIRMMFDGGKTKPRDITKGMISVFEENIENELFPGEYSLDREVVEWFYTRGLGPL